jgi:4-hydroxyphenylpyruvate dioxygenase
MRKSIATVCLSGTLEEKLAAAAHAGFDGIELFEADLIGCRLSTGEIRLRAAELGLSIDLYQPFRDFEGVSADELERNLRRAEAKFDVMEELGADTILVCSNVSDRTANDDALAADQLRALAERAADRGFRVAYEALAWGRRVHEYDHAWRIVRDADHPALGLCLDSFHILSRGTSLENIADIPGDKLFFVQVADAPYLIMDVLQWSRHYRCFPGQGGFDLSAFTSRVLDAGYPGPLSLEVFNDVFRQADPERMAVDGMRSLLLLEDSAAPRASARPLPPAVPLHGYAFVELAVDPGSLGETQTALHAFGFWPASQHRTKPVTLWHQRGIRVLVNAGAVGPPGITALAFESEDPGRSAARAEALLAQILPRWRGPGEAALSAVAAPDGSSIFFCRSREDTEGGSWLGDFDPLAPAGAPRSAGLDRIDHIALAQPFDYFDEAVLFYRSLLGLAPHESLELAAPQGLVRSRAMTNNDDSVRLALNVPVLGHDSDHPVGAQHVAFACSDIFAAARHLRGRGLQLLPIPDNYYRDLASRTELDPGQVAAMQKLGVLYDSAGGGQFLHFYTSMIADRLFFEVVQRIGGYAGYGASNAPVRMAAQRAPATTRTAMYV